METAALCLRCHNNEALFIDSYHGHTVRRQSMIVTGKKVIVPCNIFNQGTAVARKSKCQHFTESVRNVDAIPYELMSAHNAMFRRPPEDAF